MTDNTNLVDMVQAKALIEQTQQQKVLDEETANVVNLLFRELQSIYPAFKQSWPSAEDFIAAKRTWTKAFMDSKLNRIEQLRFGIKKCRLSGERFAPSVGEFIAWCTPDPEEIGLPSLDMAYHEALKNASIAPTDANQPLWSHQAIYHTALQISRFTLRNSPTEKSKKLFAEKYFQTCSKIANGEALQPLPEHKALTHQRGNSELAKTALNNIKNMLNGK